MRKKLLIVLCQSLIKEAQKSIGLVPYKIPQDKDGMVSAGDLMRQPFKFEVFHSDEYDFTLKRKSGTHVVLGNNEFQIIDYSADPRDGSTFRKFRSAAELAQYCASSQMQAASNISLSKDAEFKQLKPTKSYEDLKQYSYRIMDEQKLLGDRLTQYLSCKRARLMTWLINVLS